MLCGSYRPRHPRGCNDSVTKTRPKSSKTASRGFLASGGVSGTGHQSSAFHQCLGLLKKHPLKNTPSQADQHQHLRQQKHQHLHHHLRHHMAQPGRQRSLFGPVNPVLRPVPGIRIPECAQAVKGWPRQRPPRSGAETRAAQRASTASVLYGRAHEGKLPKPGLDFGRKSIQNG